ncbi:MAG TPA: pyridoxamine 5'-phosphate oxidase family protein [Steroidobacteraceae bacterium]|nr:pyridoxamine 5'-phosphate oxidase family protein [Steroidobacteraceae bacterium]
MSARELTDRAAVRTHFGAPSNMALAKELRTLDKHCRAFIALCPFVVLASSDAQGRCDASPRGDAPGFVAVLDDQTLAIPDRTGNKRVDTMLNLMENPRIGALFLVPGVNETLRVNGRVRISLESDLLAGMAVNGKLPNAATLIDIEEVYFQCAKAILRSDLWNPNKRVPRGTFPSLGRVLADQIKGAEAGQLEQAIEERYRTSLY